MEKSNLEDSIPEIIRNILTLRYIPTQKPSLPHLSWKDFTPTKNEVSTNFIENALVSSIKTSLDYSTKKVSIALSGGIDSTLILALLRNSFPDLEIDAISIRFADSTDETEQAAKIAKQFDANHHVIFLENFLIELPKAISITKLPFWDLHWYHIVKKAQSFSKFLVSGDGGDELFGGYTFRYQKFLSRINNESTTEERIKSYLQCHERDWVIDQQSMFGEKAKFSWELIHKLIKPYFENSLAPLEQLFLADYNGKLLYNFNPTNSAINKNFGIKAITPIISKEMIDYALHLSSNLKYDEKKNIGKLPLRKILAKYVDEEFITKDKQGFSINTQSLWKSYGYKICDYYLKDARIVKDGWINNDWIKKHLTKSIDNLDVRYINKFLGLLAFEIWYRIFITNELDSQTTLDV